MEKRQQVALVIHGGAGTILKENMTPELEQQYHQKMQEALNAGYTILNSGGSSMDAVEAAVKILEDSPLFNAGVGSVFTADGDVRLDASFMDGKTLNAGAVAGVATVKNPISAARMVMEKSPHILLTGEGADAFAKVHGLEIVENSYFHTPRRQQQLQRIQDAEQKKGDKGYYENMEDRKYGTVGAVAIDINGNIASATSTGGTTNKKWGRVGDSPIIGAGTYANNKTCGISSTGTGEYFIRGVIAYDISAMMEYRSFSIHHAAKEVIHNKLTAMGGDGGVIGLDRNGNIMMEFNTPGMYRGFITELNNPQTFIYGK